MITAVWRIAAAVTAWLRAAEPLADESLSCDHNSEQQCQDCYFEALAERW